MALSLKKHRRRRKLVVSVVCTLFVAGVAILTYALLGLWGQYHATHEPHPVVTTSVITHSTDTPSETKPTDACKTYTVPADHPKYIAIPEINGSGCVVQVGIDQHGAIAVPDNIYTAAWYVNSVLPGQPGLSVIDGHISGRYNQDAIFQHLNQLKSGDQFTITLGSGVVLRYQVFKEQLVPLDSAVGILLTKDPTVTSQLNLITCGGVYDKKIGLYDHRVIVSAKLIN